MRVPIIETKNTVEGQIIKIIHEWDELFYEFTPLINIKNAQFEALDLLTATMNLVAMLNIPQEVIEEWEEKMRRYEAEKGYKIIKWLGVKDNDEVISDEELKKFKQRLRKREILANRELTNIAWRIYKLSKKVDKPVQKVSVSYSQNKVPGKTFHERLGDYIDLNIFRSDFEKITKNVYHGYNQIFKYKYDELKNNEEIAREINMSHTTFYEFRRGAEAAFAGQLIKYGYTFEILNELLKTIEN